MTWTIDAGRWTKDADVRQRAIDGVRPETKGGQRAEVQQTSVKPTQSRRQVR